MLDHHPVRNGWSGNSCPRWTNRKHHVAVKKRKTMNKKETLNAGVVGLRVGREHVQGFGKSRANLLAVCDIDTAKVKAVQEEFAVPMAFADFDEMLACEDLDVVSIALQNHLHEPFTVKALEAGKHVLCEKPMAMNAAEAQRMVDAAASAKRKLMIRFNFRFQPASRVLKQYVDAGELGDVYYARTAWLRKRGFPGLDSWFVQKNLSGGGPLIDLGVHRLDLALWLMGYPRAVSVSAGCYSHLAKQLADRAGASVDVEDLAVAFIRLDNGAVLLLEASWALNCGQEEIRTTLFGTKGGAEQRYVHADEGFEVRMWKEIHGSMAEVTPTLASKGWETAEEHFIDSILEDRESMVTGEHGLEVMKILDAIYQSAQEGREITI